MAAPEDSAEVLSALRLGWYMAEVRGRNRPGGPVPPAESLILGQDPSTLIKPYAVFQNWHAPLRALRALWIQVVTATLSLALVIALITLIVSGSGNAFLKALFGVLGVAGLSAATVQAGLKNTAQGLLIRLRQDAYTDLVAAAIAEVPDKPGTQRQDTVVTEEIRKRTLTTAADAAVP